MAILHDQENKEIFDCKFDNFQIAVCIITFRFIAYVKNSKYMFNRIILFVGGLANLSPRSNIVQRIDADNGLYPSVIVCVHYLKLPDYSSKEVMREKLIMATNEKGFYLN